MKRIFTFLISLTPFFFLSAPLLAQSNGDYETNGTGGGDWSFPSTWQVFNAGAWGPAATAPDNTAGVITILSGDSVAWSGSAAGPTTADQIVVASGGLIAIFPNPSTTFTLDNSGTGDDLIIKAGGRVRLVNATLQGAGTVNVNGGGIFSLESGATLSVGTLNNGEFAITNNVNIANTTLTNDSLINWLDNSITLSSANVINNDSLSTQAGIGGFGFSGTGTVSNNGVIFNGAGNTAGSFPGVAFNNTGRLEGTGEYVWEEPTSTNSGVFMPGAMFSPATLTLDGQFPSIHSASPGNFYLGLWSGGDVQGTNYSDIQVDPARGFSLDLSADTLTVPDYAVGDANGTVYDLIDYPGGTVGTGIQNSFAFVNISPSLGMLTITPSSVTVTRIVVLPLTWGPFTAIAVNGSVQLKWYTYEESNTASFIVQHSDDGEKYDDIGTLAAAGNSSVTNGYAFVDQNPNKSGSNYYRIVEVDRDGKQNVSTIRIVNFTNGSAVAVQMSPNPVKDMLQITVQADEISLTLNDMAGRVIRTMRLDQGYYQTSMSNLAAGVYQVNIYQRSQLIGTQKIVKL